MVNVSNLSASLAAWAMQDLATPPTQVEAVVAAAMTVLKRPTAWKQARTELAQPELLDALLAHDATSIDGVLTNKLTRALSAPGMGAEVSI